jgi:hypothetical protein
MYLRRPDSNGGVRISEVAIIMDGGPKPIIMTLGQGLRELRDTIGGLSVKIGEMNVKLKELEARMKSK